MSAVTQAEPTQPKSAAKEALSRQRQGQTPEAKQELICNRRPAYLAVQWTVGLILRTFFRMRVTGYERVPKEGGVVLAANHESWLDIPMIAAAGGRRHVAFVARASLGNLRAMGWLMHQAGAVLVEYNSSDREALALMVQHLRKGDCVAVFPEGTRSLDGEMDEFRAGAVLAARRAGVPLIAVGITGAYKAWPRGQRWPRLRRVGVHFGQLFPASSLKDPKATEHLRDAVQATVAIANANRKATV